MPPTADQSAVELFAALVEERTQPDAPPVSPRQVVVGYLYVVREQERSEIMATLSISAGTVNTHLTRLAESLGYASAVPMRWALHGEYHHRVGYAEALAEQEDAGG